MPFCEKCGYTAASAESACRICGQPLTESPLEPNPANPVTPTLVTTPATVPVSASSRLRRRLALIGAPLAVVAGLVAFGFHYLHSTPTFEELIPAGTPAVAVVDARWWWDATGDVRAVPEVRDGIKDFEKQSGLSLENDIASWVGQTGIAVMNVDQKHPQGVACLQVRDWTAFFRFFRTLTQKATKDGGMKVIEDAYNGVKIQRLKSTDKDDAGMPKISVAWIKGWVLLGVGEGSLEKVIDTYQGKTPSLAKDPTWAAALAHRPAHWFMWGGAESRGLASALKPLATGANMDSLGGMIPGMPSVMPDRDSSDGLKTDSLDDRNAKTSKAFDQMAQYPFVVIGCASDMGNGLRFDAYTIAGSDKVKNLWRDVKGTSGGVSGDILAQLPKDADIAFLAHDPAGWWTRYKKAILEAVTEKDRKDIEPVLKEIKPAEAILADYPGDCGLTFTYRDGTGVGAVLLAQAKSPLAAAESARSLVDYLKKNQVKVNPKGTDLYTLPELVDHTEPLVPLAPEFGVQKDYFVATSSPVWTAPNAPRGSALILPTEAHGADFVALGNFTWLPALLKSLDTPAKGEPAPKSPDPSDRAMHDTGLEAAHWDAYTKIAPDGATQQSTWEIENWDWRQAEKREIKDAQDSEAATKKSGGISF